MRNGGSSIVCAAAPLAASRWHLAAKQFLLARTESIHHRMRAHHIVALAALVGSTVMCGGGGSGPTGPGSGSGATTPGGTGGTAGTDPYGGGTPVGDNGCTTVAAGTVCLGSDLTFTPVTITIAHGATVAFQNNAGMTHNVTFDAVTGAPANVPDFASGTKSVAFPTAGTFNYHCTIHGVAMHGTVVVQ